ncbi:MAG: hypothetical protein R2822_30635 [Spirosomataceae bacterium]
MGKIVFTTMTLQEKAAFYDKQVRTRHIRNGFNGTLTHEKWKSIHRYTARL